MSDVKVQTVEGKSIVLLVKVMIHTEPKMNHGYELGLSCSIKESQL